MSLVGGVERNRHGESVEDKHKMLVWRGKLEGREGRTCHTARAHCEGEMPAPHGTEISPGWTRKQFFL